MAVPEKEEVKYLYSQLKGRGYNVGKDADEFAHLLETNSESRRWAYEKGRLNGLSVGKTYDEFSTKVAPVAKRPAAKTPTATEQGWNISRPGRQLTSTIEDKPTSTKSSSTPQSKTHRAQQAPTTKTTPQKPTAAVPLTPNAPDDYSEYGYSQARYDSTTPLVDDVAEKLSDEKQPLAPLDTQHVIGEKVEEIKQDQAYDSLYNQYLVESTKEIMRNIAGQPLRPGLGNNGVDSALQRARENVGSDLGMYLLDKAVTEGIADADKNADREIASINTNDALINSPYYVGSGFSQQAAINRHSDIDKLTQNALDKMSDTDKNEIIKSIALSNELYDLKQKGVPDYRLPNVPSQKYIDAASKNLKESIRNEFFNRYVERLKPKSKAEQFIASAINSNTMATLLAYGTMPKWKIEATLLGQQMFEQENGSGAGLLGSGFGMVTDPFMYLTSGTATAATNFGTRMAGRAMLGKAATRAAQKTFANKFATKLGQRTVHGMVNLGLYEGGAEAIRQGAYGGYYNPETGQIEGYNPGAILSQTIHGATMGAATGATGFMFGNASQKAVNAIGTGTVGQTVARASVLAASKVTAPVLEATVFSIPEFVSSEGNKFDSWVHNLEFIGAMRFANAVVKPGKTIKSAKQTITELSSMTKANGYKSIRERVDDYITRHNGEPNYFLTNDELQELKECGYDDLGLLFSGKGKPFDLAYKNARDFDDAARQVEENKEYNLLGKAIDDARLSQAVRARLYFIATNRCLPVHTAVRADVELSGDGYKVQTYDKDGVVVTTKYFKDRAKAEKYKATTADRQVELNAMYTAEQMMVDKTLADANEKAIQELAQKYGQSTYSIRRILADYATAPEKADEFAKKLQKEYAEAIPDADEIYNSTAVAIKKAKVNILQDTGVSVDEAMRKKASERTDEEQNAIDAYLDACEQANQPNDVYEKIRFNDSDNVVFAMLDNGKRVAIQRGNITIDEFGRVYAEPGTYRCFDFELGDYFNVDESRITNAQAMPIEAYKEGSKEAQTRTEQRPTAEVATEQETAGPTENTGEEVAAEDVQANEVWTLPIRGRKAEAVVVDREGDKLTVWTSDPITEGSEQPRTFGRGYITELTADEFVKLGARPKEEPTAVEETAQPKVEQTQEQPMQTQTATETNPIIPEEAKAVELPKAETTDPDAMPMREVDYGDGEVGKEPDFAQTTPERTARYLDDESGMESTDVDKFVDNMITKATKAAEEHAQQRPEMGEDEMPGRFSQRLNEWKRQGEELQAQKDYWNAVKAERERKAQEPTEVESVPMEDSTAETDTTKTAIEEQREPESTEVEAQASPEKLNEMIEFGDVPEREKAIDERTQSLEKDFGLKVKVAKSIDEVANENARVAIENGAEVTGFYDMDTGEVVIYAPNIKNVSQIEKTYAHEVVGHVGMRGLLGEERYNDFCNKVWDFMSEDAQNKYSKYPGVDGDRALAADEYLAHVAENIDVYKGTTMWERIKHTVRSILQDMGITNVTDKDIEYMLRRSAERLREQQQHRKKVVDNVNSLFSNIGGKGTHYSTSSGFEGAGFEAGERDGNDLKPYADAEGNAVVKLGNKEFSAKNPITERDVLDHDSILKLMLNDAFDLGAISKRQYDKIVRKYTQQLNYYLQIGAKENGGVFNLTDRWMWLGETVYKTVASNSDKQYSTSIDITRVCKKNEAVIRAISELQKRLHYGVTPAQILDIYESTVVEGYQAPCPVCYVFSRYIRNGKQASSIIYGMRKYGKHLAGGDGPTWTAEDWVKELGRLKEQKKDKRITDAIEDANADVLLIPGKIDELIKKIDSAKGNKEEQEQYKAEIRALDVKYRQALDVISRQSMTQWITSFAIQSVDKKWVMRDDAKLPENIEEFEELALDVRRTAEAMIKYPGIQRHRKSYGSSSGKEITFESNNELGEVALGIGQDPDNPFKNPYADVLKATTKEEKETCMKAAKRALETSIRKAKQQSLRGGQRMWSWSDNIERLSNDVAVNLMQMEIVGGALQSYSKQLEGVRLVASMGGYVNGSLMGKGIGYREVQESDTEIIDGQRVLKGGEFKYTIKKEDGTNEERVLHSPVFQDKDGKYYTLEFDDVVGIDPFGKDDGNGNHLKGLFELNATMDKAGNILVGMDDIHIRTALADDRIFFVIPWHSSGGNNHILKQMLFFLGRDTTGFNAQDYTLMQEEKFIYEKDKCPKKMPNAWKVPKRLVDFWESHNYEKKYRCGIGHIESGENGGLSKSQIEYRNLRDMILRGVAEEYEEFDKKKGKMVTKTKYVNISEYPELMKKVLADEFLSQVYYKINEDPITKVPGGMMTSGDTEYIYPYEYWDMNSTYKTADVNGERYLEYCRRMGRRPKFSGYWDAKEGSANAKIGDFTDCKGYWKLLIDRRMYDVNGKFQDLTPIDSEGFQPEYTDSELTKNEFVITKVADEEGVQRIVDRAVEQMTNRTGEMANVDYDLSMDEAVERYQSNSTKVTPAVWTASDIVRLNNKNKGRIAFRVEDDSDTIGEVKLDTTDKTDDLEYRFIGEKGATAIDKAEGQESRKVDTPAFKNNRGSRIARGGKVGGVSYQVGKVMAGTIYFHKNYADQVLPEGLLEKAEQYLPEGFTYNTLAWDPKQPNVLRFDECEGFDTDLNPVVGRQFKVNVESGEPLYKTPDGTRYEAQIFHDKWQWVGNDYKGFDVQESYNWSKLYNNRIESTPSGRLEKWQEQLRKAGLTDQENMTTAQLYRNTAEQVAKSVGEEVTVVEKVEDIVDDDPKVQLKKRGAKGWYDPETGKVVVNLSAHRDAADVAETVFHETIGHKGIEEMMGRERFDRMIDEVWSHAADDVRRAVYGLMRGNDGWDYRKATREYLAGLAEKVDKQGFDSLDRSEQSIWQKVKSKIEDFLNRILADMKIPARVRLSEKDLSYMMWKVYDTKRREAQGETVIDRAQAEMRRREWNKNGKIKVVSEEQVSAEKAKQSLGESMKEAAKQDYGSADTSINSNKLPSGFGLITKRGGWESGMINLDMGGGRFDNATEMLAEKGVTNLIFDPYNRSREHNRGVAQRVNAERVDTTTCNNVLNVINTKGARSNVILQCAKALKPGGVSYFTVYEGNGTGKGAVSKNDCWQENRKTEDYISEIEQHYRDVKRVGKLIIAKDPIVDGKTSIWKFEATGESSLEFRDPGEQSAKIETPEDIFDGEIIEMLKKQKDDVEVLNTAVAALAGSTAKISKILRQQKKYDKSTVKNVAMAVRRMLAANVFSEPTRAEINSMLAAVQHSIDKDDVTESVDRLTDMFIDNQQRVADKTFAKLCSTKGSKINTNGVETMSKLDPRGQMILNELNTCLELSAADRTSRRDELQDKMDTGTEAQRAEAAIKLLGFDIADAYQSDVTDIRSSIALIRNDLDELKKSYSKNFTKQQLEQYREQKKALYELLREAKLNLIETTRRASEELYGTLNDSFTQARQFREDQAAHKNEIHHEANSDLAGVNTSEVGQGRSFTKSIINSVPARFLLAPLGTFEQVCRMFGSKYMDGEGKIFTRFVKGWQKCADVEQIENEKAEDEMNQFAAGLLDKEKARYSDLYDLSKKKVDCKLTWKDGGVEREFTITQGNLMYLYAVNKMPDGRIKLQNMGLSSDMIDGVVEQYLDPRLKSLADWAQQEFLPKLRDRYSAVNERMFGSPMEDIDNYFPIRILQNSLVKEDELKDTNGSALPKTITGSVIKRTYNKKPIDILNSDGVSVLLDHVREMNNWAAFAEYRQDLSTLLSYKTFSNKVKNMKSIYGAGDELWKTFHDLSMVVAGAYEPKVTRMDKYAVNLSKIAVGSCIAIRLNTALKQTLSYPAFAQDADLAKMFYNITPWRAAQCFMWAKNNMPSFRKRWSSKQAGNEILKEWKQDWNWTQCDFMKTAQRFGMAPNSFVDAMTVACGSEAVYTAKKKQYLKQGLDEEAAHDRAVIDAEVAFNLSQQSSEAPYVSMMQVERSYITTMLTMFRNSSMSYGRQMVQSAREISNMLKYKNEQLAHEVSQLVEQGMDRDTAEKVAERKYYKNYARNAVKFVNFAYVLPTLWSLGCSGIYYLLFGDDKDKKKELIEDSAKRGILGFGEGLTGGGTLPQVFYDLSQGNKVDFETNPNIALSMLQEVIDYVSRATKEAKGDKDATGYNEALLTKGINALVSCTFGYNPQTIEDAVIATMDYVGSDWQSFQEVGTLLMRVANVPQSQLDMLYFDELGMTAREASKLTPRELCERYAHYKAKRAYFISSFYVDEKRWGELKEPYRKQFNKEAKALLESKNDKKVNDDYNKYLSYYQEFNKRRNDILNDTELTDEEKESALKEAMSSGDLLVANKCMKAYNPWLEKMTKSWLESETPEEAAKNLNSCINYKAQLVELIDQASDDQWSNKPSKEVRAAENKLDSILGEWAQRNPKLLPRRR